MCAHTHCALCAANVNIHLDNITYKIVFKPSEKKKNHNNIEMCTNRKKVHHHSSTFTVILMHHEANGYSLRTFIYPFSLVKRRIIEKMLFNSLNQTIRFGVHDERVAYARTQPTE